MNYTTKPPMCHCRAGIDDNGECMFDQCTLCAAAPKLLKACKAALQFVGIDFGEMGHAVVNHSGEVWQKLDAAIAKAEGKE